MYITKERALEAGLTHEGTLYGVPAWFADDGNGETSMATPKFLPLQAWCYLADKAFDLAACFMPATCVLESPITITGRIEP